MKFILPWGEMTFESILGSGPGGQNVNKTATTIRLQWNILETALLPDDVKIRFLKIAGKKVDTNGIITIVAGEFREQSRNREAAINRLSEFLKKAWTPPKKRVATRPSLASKKRRLESKKRTSSKKKDRSKSTSVTDFYGE